MTETIFYILNIFFFLFHGMLIVFNVSGWLFERTRVWNLITLLATGASWFVLGIWKGWGYCPCTDWHWQVRRQLDLETDTGSYIDFLLNTLLGIDLPRAVVDAGTLVVFMLCLVASLWVNLKGINLIRKS